MINHIDILNSPKDYNYAVVVCSFPESEKVIYMGMNLLNHNEKYSYPKFILEPFSKNSSLPGIQIIPDFYEEVNCVDFENQIKNTWNSNLWPTPSQKNESSTQKDDFIQWVEKAKDYFSHNNLEKIMLSKIKTNPLPERFNALKYFLSLKKAYPGAFVSIISSPFSGTWIGATPELLLEQNEHKVSTISLAGTKLKTPFKEWTNKEYHEQALVTKYIHNLFLENQLLDSEIIGPLDHTIGHLVHLKTTLKATLSPGYTEKQIHQLLESLHPTPAVGGYPKNEAISLIPKLEKHDRFYYSGYMGLQFSPNELIYYVNLRCMFLTSDTYSIITGAGITEGSIPESEWEETENKANILLQLMLNMQ